MAQDIDKILAGGAVVSVGPWVTAGGAGSLVEVGHTEGATELIRSYEDLPVSSEQIAGIEKRIPISTEMALKFAMKETDLENWRMPWRQPAANLTGTPPNMTLLVGAAAEQYHQVTLVGTGIGTTGVRTVTAWRMIVDSVEPIRMAKAEAQLVTITGALMLDSSVATLDQFLKIVDA